MAPKQPNTGLFVGLNRGHVVTKKELAPRPSDRKGVRPFLLYILACILSVALCMNAKFASTIAISFLFG